MKEQINQGAQIDIQMALDITGGHYQKLVIEKRLISDQLADVTKQLAQAQAQNEKLVQLLAEAKEG